MNSLENYFQPVVELTSDKIQSALSDALKKIDKKMLRFGKLFPGACTKNGIYAIDDNTGGWTTSFWTGQLWLAYELTGDEKYKKCAMDHMDSFGSTYAIPQSCLGEVLVGIFLSATNSLGIIPTFSRNNLQK